MLKKQKQNKKHARTHARTLNTQRRIGHACRGESVQELAQPPVDVVIGTDVFYEPHVYPLLLRTVCDLAGPNSLVLFSYRPRGNHEHSFIEMAASEFRVKEVCTHLCN